MGEYGLALDGIADAYMTSNVRMPPDLFAVLDQLVSHMDLAGDPEFSGLVAFRKAQAAV